MVDFSVLENHSTIMFQNSLKEVAAINFLISVNQAQPPRFFLLICESNIARVDTILHRFDVFKHDKAFPIDNISANEFLEFLRLNKWRKFHKMSFFDMVDWDQLAVVCTFRWDPKFLLVVVGYLLAVQIVLVKLYAFYESLLVEGQSPSVKFAKNEVGHDLATQWSENQCPSLQ